MFLSELTASQSGRSIPPAASQSEPAPPAARTLSSSQTAPHRTPDAPPSLALPPSCAPPSSQNSYPHRPANLPHNKDRATLLHPQFPHSPPPQNLLAEPKSTFPRPPVSPA